MFSKKKLIFFLILLSLNNCSFDNKTGIWGDSEKEKIRISELEKKQKEIINIEKIYSSDSIFQKEKKLGKSIILSKPKNNQEWRTTSLNLENSIGNIYLPGINNIFLKKKIGKDKFSTHNAMTPLLAFDNNIILSDDKGTIFNITKRGKVNWKKNIYKKVYKRIHKSLVFSISENNIYVADNIGFIYSIDISNGNVLWIKNYAVPIKSNMKIFNDKIFLIDQDNKILCFNTKDGSLIWDFLSISSFIKSQNLLSLAVSKDGYLFAITSSADVYKIKVDNGQIIWSRNSAESLYADSTDFFTSSEIVLNDDDIIFSSSFTMYSYDSNTGITNWKNDISSVATPIVDGDNIFIVTENGYFAILNKNSGKINSSVNILKVLKRKKQQTKVTGFIMGSGKIYSVTSNGFLIVSSANTGKVEYFKKIGEQNMSPPIISNGELFILLKNSKIVGLN